MLWKQRCIADKGHGPAMLYEVILPHLVGPNGSVTDALERGSSADRHGHWETVQRAGTCYFRCILCCWRALMKWDGFTKGQQKDLFFQVRQYYIGMVEVHLRVPRYARDLVDSDVKIIRYTM